MKYTIYQITNKVNGKVYIGKHQTKDPYDDYMGSGKLIQAAIKKYGADQFEKKVLHVFDNEEDMNAKEADLVTPEFVKEDTNYNLCPGGQGGWGYINSTDLRTSGHSEDMYKRVSATLSGRSNPEVSVRNKRLHEEGKLSAPNWTGRTHTEETKAKLRRPKNQGKANSQFGTMWITNGEEARKIKKTDPIPDGWKKGRR